jgi:WhiB family redox-sensing transcriptional regulator
MNSFDQFVKQIVDRPSWMGRASCKNLDVEMFFPKRGLPKKEVVRICGACPVREECLSFAVLNGERQGMWGGLTSGARRGMYSKIKKEIEDND